MAETAELLDPARIGVWLGPSVLTHARPSDSAAADAFVLTVTGPSRPPDLSATDDGARARDAFGSWRLSALLRR
ncbi:hypothetical protein ACFWMU_26970 [Streptomyces sp. NPDC058357]|uniref:hypothetical protein n=1 Tax=unclassified Streptomyces TaxID=2593676 RepID=UPI00364D5C67